jgi:hypothetical protein
MSSESRAIKTVDEHSWKLSSARQPMPAAFWGRNTSVDGGNYATGNYNILIKLCVVIQDKRSPMPTSGVVLPPSRHASAYGCSHSNTAAWFRRCSTAHLQPSSRSEQLLLFTYLNNWLWSQHFQQKWVKGRCHDMAAFEAGRLLSHRHIELIPWCKRLHCSGGYFQKELANVGIFCMINFFILASFAVSQDFQLVVIICDHSMLRGSLSPQHGLSSGCGWRKSTQLWKMTRGGPPTWVLGVGLATLDRKIWICYKNQEKASDQNGSFG